MKLYNTLTRQKEEFIPLEPGKVKLYACGPTVYNYIHIGNARPLCVFDVLRRYLEHKGYAVTFVQNLTDIDDKIINRAKDEGCTYREVADRFIAEFLVDAQGLGVRPPTIAPRATDAMDEIISMVEGLIKKGFAYEAGGDVYFRSRRFEEYGKLSNQPLDDLNAGARVEATVEKEDSLDFVVWKAAKPGEPSWQSPWGQGRPGWHIECSAMVGKYLGETIDIHTGGQDLIFPHHENEIAQSECYHGKPYVKYWLHNGYINVDSRKMSKSVGNFFTVRDVAGVVGYEPIKYFLLQAHYRSPLNYNEESMSQCVSALERIYTSRNNLDFALSNADSDNTEGQEEFSAQLVVRKKQFETAMEDDINTADALAALFELIRDTNLYLTTPRPPALIREAIELFDTFTGILGLLYNRKPEVLDGEVEALIQQREDARKSKDFATADKIRDALRAQGIVLEDTPQGVKFHRK